MSQTANTVGEHTALPQTLYTIEDINKAHTVLERCQIPTSVINLVLDDSHVNEADFAELLECILDANIKTLVTDDEGQPFLLDLQMLGKGGQGLTRRAWFFATKELAVVKIQLTQNQQVQTEHVVHVDPQQTGMKNAPSTSTAFAFDSDAATNDFEHYSQNQEEDSGEQGSLALGSTEQTFSVDPSHSVLEDESISKLDLGNTIETTNIDVHSKVITDNSTKGGQEDEQEDDQFEVFMPKLPVNEDEDVSIDQYSGLLYDLNEFKNKKKVHVFDGRYTRELTVLKRFPEKSGFLAEGVLNGHKMVVLKYLGKSFDKILAPGNDNENKNVPPLSEDAVKLIGVLLAKEIHILHKKGELRHLDIKPHNFVIDKHGFIHIIDYGLCEDNLNESVDKDNWEELLSEVVENEAAREYEEDDDIELTDQTLQNITALRAAEFRMLISKRTSAGSIPYISPECAKAWFETEFAGTNEKDLFLPVNSMKQGEHSDVYSFGRVLYYLATKQSSLVTKDFKKRLIEIGSKAHYSSDEFKERLAALKDKDLRASIESCIKFHTSDRATLEEFARQHFYCTPLVLQFASFEEYWESETKASVPGFSEGSVELDVHTINKAVEKYKLTTIQKIGVAARAGIRSIIQHPIITTTTITGALGLSIVSYNFYSYNAEQRAKSELNLAVATLIKEDLPSNQQLAAIRTHYNQAINRVGSGTVAEYRQRILEANADNAFDIDFSADGIVKVELTLTQQKEALVEELTTQIQVLDGTAQTLDDVDLTKANEIYATMLSNRYEEFRGTLPVTIGEEYEIRTNGVVHIVHKAEEAKATALRAAYAELTELLATEDGPHTKRVQAKLASLNYDVEAWEHRTHVLDDIEEVGITNLPAFITHDYNEDTAELILKNKVEESDDESKLFYSRFGTFTIKDNCITSIVLAGENVQMTHFMHYYKAPNTYSDSQYAAMMFNAESIRPFIANISSRIEKNNRNNYWYLSLKEGDSIFLACNSVQGYFQFDTSQDTIDYVEVLNEVDIDDVDLLRQITQVDFDGYSTYIDVYAGIEKNIPDMINRFAEYVGQYPAITEVLQEKLDEKKMTLLDLREEDIRNEEQPNSDY